MENIHDNRTSVYQRHINFGLYNIKASGNILRKVAVHLGISLAEAGKAALTLPKRYTLDMMRRVYRKNGETRLQPVSE